MIVRVCNTSTNKAVDKIDLNKKSPIVNATIATDILAIGLGTES